MRILGIDYGSKRVGVAVSDESRTFALPVAVIANVEGFMTEIEKIALEQGTKEIVMGESKNYKGESNTVMANISAFKGELEKKGFTVHLEPEFMTSVAAERFQGKNELHDASAAALILQSFLDTQKNSA